MKKLILVIALLLFCSTAQATLIDNGGGLIYDDVLDMTWLQDANYAFTTSHTGVGVNSSTGQMTWDASIAWADTLIFQDYDDWRLPETLPINGVSYNLDVNYDGSADRGWNITSPNNEMAHLFKVTLGNPARVDTSGNTQDGNPLTGNGWDWDGLANNGPFNNLMADVYWSGTEYTIDDFWNKPRAWYFNFWSDAVNHSGDVPYFAWAVRDGNSTPISEPIPEPSTWILLGIGLIVMAVIAIRKKKALIKDM